MFIILRIALIRSNRGLNYTFNYNKQRYDSTVQPGQTLVNQQSNNARYPEATRTIRVNAGAV